MSLEHLTSLSDHQLATLVEKSGFQTGKSIDLSTGELKDTPVYVAEKQCKQRVDSTMKSHIAIARKFSGNMGEKVITTILGTIKRMESKLSQNGHKPDIIISQDDRELIFEVKARRLPGTIVITKSQLEKIETLERDCYYSFVFYRTKNNKTPVGLIRHHEKAGLETPINTYLRRNMSIDSVFILPSKLITLFANTSKKTFHQIGDSNESRILLSKSDAKDLFQLALRLEAIEQQDKHINTGEPSFHFLPKKRTVNQRIISGVQPGGSIFPVYAVGFSPQYAIPDNHKKNLG